MFVAKIYVDKNYVSLVEVLNAVKEGLEDFDIEADRVSVKWEQDDIEIESEEEDGSEARS